MNKFVDAMLPVMSLWASGFMFAEGAVGYAMVMLIVGFGAMAMFYVEHVARRLR
jgi:hypothetical protein